MTRVLSSVLAIGLLISTTAEAGHPHNRNGFMIGFGVGGGSLGLEDVDSREGSATGNFRIGYAVAPHLAIHLESNAWSKTFENILVGFESDGTPVFGDLVPTVSNALGALTYYAPQTGLFLRGGVGLGTVGVELKTGGVTISDDEKGLAVLTGIGYEWRLTKKFALAPGFEFVYQSLDLLGSSTLIAGGLGFNWYW